MLWVLQNFQGVAGVAVLLESYECCGGKKKCCRCCGGFQKRSVAETLINVAGVWGFPGLGGSFRCCACALS